MSLGEPADGDRQVTESFYKDPVVSALFACPNCKRLPGYTLDQCPHCLELIGEDQKLIGTAMHVTVTQACSLANTISTGDPAVIIFLGITALSYVADIGWMACVTIISGVMPFMAILRWRRRYGWLPVEDAEFIAAKRVMKQSMMLWSGFLFLELVIAYSFWV